MLSTFHSSPFPPFIGPQGFPPRLGGPLTRGLDYSKAFFPGAVFQCADMVGRHGTKAVAGAKPYIPLRRMCRCRIGASPNTVGISIRMRDRVDAGFLATRQTWPLRSITVFNLKHARDLEVTSSSPHSVGRGATEQLMIWPSSPSQLSREPCSPFHPMVRSMVSKQRTIAFT
jgi:hypothetical protein